jgi:alcohol dehydrogenase class IV
MVAVFRSLSSRVVFGKGALGALAEEAAALACRRVLVICTGSQGAVAERAVALLGKAGGPVFREAAMHTPVEVTETAMAVVKAEGVDGLVAIGGGSAIGLSKAISLRTNLPQIAIPTTYAGSEMTPVLGQTEAGRKTTQRTIKVMPETVIYDVDLSLSLPVAVSVTSGFNAIAHGVEALYAESPNAMLLAIAEESIRLMVHALPRILAAPEDEAARSEALQAAWLAGWSLANGGSGLHHRLCHVLGGAFGLPHAETHTVLLPHIVAYNTPDIPDALARLGRAMDASYPADALHDLALQLGAPTALKDLGMPKAGIEPVVEAIVTAGGWNPRAPDEAALKRVLRRAYNGERPRIERGAAAQAAS